MLNTSSKQNEHPSAKSTLDGNFPSRTKWANNKLATYAAMWSVGLGGALLERAKAGLYASGTPSQEMLDVGSHLKGRTLHLKLYSPTITSGSTDQSATFWNSQFAITSYHNIANYISNYTKMELTDTVRGFKLQAERGLLAKLAKRG